MIFVTVGTHEDSFDRLISEVDRLKGIGCLRDEVFIQTGYSQYQPVNCSYKELVGFQEMDEYVRQARLIITHGGPGSILHPLKYGKIPIVVPRQSKYQEHVDDHQVMFARRLEAGGKILAVYEMDRLWSMIDNYANLAQAMRASDQAGQTNLNNFVQELDRISMSLVGR